MLKEVKMTLLKARNGSKCGLESKISIYYFFSRNGNLSIHKNTVKDHIILNSHRTERFDAINFNLKSIRGCEKDFVKQKKIGFLFVILDIQWNQWN